MDACIGVRGCLRASQVQEQVTGLIARAAELHDELDRERAAARAHCDRLAASAAAVEAAQQQPLPQLPEARSPLSAESWLYC